MFNIMLNYCLSWKTIATNVVSFLYKDLHIVVTGWTACFENCFCKQFFCLKYFSTLSCYEDWVQNNAKVVFLF